MYWLVEHKTFTGFIALGLILLALVYYFAIGPLQAQALSRHDELLKLRATIESKVKNGQFMTSRSVQNAESELKLVEDRYTQLVNRINYKPMPDYEPATTTKLGDMIVNFQSLMKDAQKRMEQKSAERNIPIPTKLEFPLANATPETIFVFYQKLDIMEQLVSLAMDANCQKIITLGGAVPADFKEFKDIKETVLKTGLTNKNLVYLKINGKFASIMQFIDLLRKADRFVSIEKAILDNPDPDSDNATATFVIAGVKLVEAGK